MLISYLNSARAPSALYLSYEAECSLFQDNQELSHFVLSHVFSSGEKDVNCVGEERTWTRFHLLGKFCCTPRKQSRLQNSLGQPLNLLSRCLTSTSNAVTTYQAVLPEHDSQYKMLPLIIIFFVSNNNVSDLLNVHLLLLFITS